MSPYLLKIHLARFAKEAHFPRMTVEELRQEASQLPENERGSLIADLLATFGPATYDVSDDEVAQRVAETEAGEVEDISFEELRAGIEARHSK